MNSHDCLLTNLRNGIELVLSSDVREVSRDCLAVRSVAAVLCEGLRDPSTGYWHVLRELMHSSTRSNIARHLKHVTNNSDRGVFWIYYTLVEGSLESYMECLVYDVATLKKYYSDAALLRNSYLSTKFLLLLSILSETTLTPLDSFSCPKFSFDTNKTKDSLLYLLPLPDETQDNYLKPLRNLNGGLKISSLQSIEFSSCSPTSPVDSGVALISDVDDTYSLSEMIIDKTEDDTPMSETEDNTSEIWNDINIHGDEMEDGDKTPTNEFIFPEILTNKEDPEKRWDGEKTPEAAEVAQKHEEFEKNIEGYLKCEDPDKRNNENNRSELLRTKELEKSFEDCRLSLIHEDGVVLRRRKKKSGEGDVKRVSFHEDVVETSSIGDGGDDSPKKTRVIRERHSLDAEEECGFLSQLFGSGMSLLQECGLEALELDSERFGAFRRSWCAPSSAGSNKQLEQDNLIHTFETSTTRDTASESEYSDLGSVRLRKPPGRELRHKLLRKTLPAQLRSASKMSLLTRFLRSIPPVKLKRRSIVYLGPRPTVPELDRETEAQIQAEVESAVAGIPPPTERENRLAEGLKNVLCCDRIYRVFRMANVEGEAVLGVLTESKLFVMSAFGLSRSIRKCLDYKELDTVIVGPGEQIIMLVTNDKNSYVLFPDNMVGNNSGCDFCASLQIVVSRCRVAVRNRRLLNFHRLSVTDMASLRTQIRDCTGSKNEECLHYVWVHAEDTVPKLHLTKQSHLMFSVGRTKKWEPGLVTLKRNSLNFKSDSVDLTFDVNGCTSCDRIATNRPHTFVVKFSNKHPVVLATPDDYEMSDWMQRILFAASNKSELVSPDCEEKSLPPSYGLVLTTDHLVTTRFPDEVVNCTKITDIGAVLIGKTCCVLELDCHEVRDRNGDWILYFSTETSLTEFMDLVISLHPDIEKLVLPITSSSTLVEKCDDTSRELAARFGRLETSYVEL